MKKLISASLLASVALLPSCGSENSSDVKERLSRTTTEAEVEKALSAAVAFRVNLTTNRLTFYKGGVPVDQWNIATGDISGYLHDGEKKYTPTGIFSVDAFKHCPIWRPAKVRDPSTGVKTRDYSVRKKVFESNPSVYGACGSRNPLGEYMISFTGPYYLHGNSNESVLRRPKAEDRRVSGGCVRNPNRIIAKYFHRALNEFDSLRSFSSDVRRNEKKSRPSTLATYVKDKNIRVVVGWLGKDPVVGKDSAPSEETMENRDNGEVEENEGSSDISKSQLKKAKMTNMLGASVNLTGRVKIDLDASMLLADEGSTLRGLSKSSVEIMAYYFGESSNVDLGTYDVNVSASDDKRGTFKLSQSLISKIRELSSGAVYLKMTYMQETKDGDSASTPLYVTSNGKKYYAVYIDPTTQELFLK